MFSIPQFDTLPNHRLAYLMMRKSGCTSIKRALDEFRATNHNLPDENVHVEHSDLINAANLKPDDWFTFTIVREPISRFLSFYHNKICDQNIHGNPTINERQLFGYLPNMRIDHAIDTLTNPAFPTEPHAEIQSLLIDDVGFDLDLVGKIESLPNALNFIESKTGIGLSVGHLNRRRSTHSLINRQQYERLAEYYREDIEQFNYPATFDDWMDQIVKPSSDSYSNNPGYEFRGEATLLDYTIARKRWRFEIELLWRVAPTQTRCRHIRVVRFLPGKARPDVLFYLRANVELVTQTDQDGMLLERVVFPHERVPEALRGEELFLEVYFWDDKQLVAELVNARVGYKKLLIALPTASDIAAEIVPASYSIADPLSTEAT